jgi:pyruvate formate lyase activating enzyme
MILMAECKLCNIASNNISQELGICLKCIRERPKDALLIAMQAYARSRAAFGLPEKPPKDPQGIPCTICVNECRFRRRDGVLRVKEQAGRLIGVSPAEKTLMVSGSLPTNCVGDWYVWRKSDRLSKYAHCQIEHGWQEPDGILHVFI